MSIETIYKTFGNKPGLLKAVFDVAIAGDDAPVPIVDRAWVAEINAQPDPRRKLRMYAQHLSTSMPRAGPVQLLVRAAATAHPEIDDVWRGMLAERLRGMTAFATHLVAGGHVRRRMTVGHARDVLWIYNSVELYELLVLERGWTLTRYRDFIAGALIAALLPD